MPQISKMTFRLVNIFKTSFRFHQKNIEISFFRLVVEKDFGTDCCNIK